MPLDPGHARPGPHARAARGARRGADEGRQEAIGAKPENVRVVLNECEPEHWFVGGESLADAAGLRQALMLVPLGEPGGPPASSPPTTGAGSRVSPARRRASA